MSVSDNSGAWRVEAAASVPTPAFVKLKGEVALSGILVEVGSIADVRTACSIPVASRFKVQPCDSGHPVSGLQNSVLNITSFVLSFAPLNLLSSQYCNEHTCLMPRGSGKLDWHPQSIRLFSQIWAFCQTPKSMTWAYKTSATKVFTLRDIYCEDLSEHRNRSTARQLTRAPPSSFKGPGPIRNQNA